MVADPLWTDESLPGIQFVSEAEDVETLSYLLKTRLFAPDSKHPGAQSPEARQYTLNRGAWSFPIYIEYTRGNGGQPSLYSLLRDESFSLTKNINEINITSKGYGYVK
jgi:hypothetical protein